MRAFLIPAAFAAILTTAPLAFAGDSGAGQMTRSETTTIKSVNPSRGFFVVADGDTFAIPAGPTGAKLKAGTKVQLTYDLEGSEMVLDNLHIIR